MHDSLKTHRKSVTISGERITYPETLHDTNTSAGFLSATFSTIRGRKAGL